MPFNQEKKQNMQTARSKKTWDPSENNWKGGVKNTLNKHSCY